MIAERENSADRQTTREMNRTGWPVKVHHCAVLNEEDVERTIGRVESLSSIWTRRGKASTSEFYTLGAAAYLDVAGSPDPRRTYFAKARSENPLLRHVFRDEYRRVVAALEKLFGVPVGLHPGLAAPGFHVWRSAALMTDAEVVPHFDLQFVPLVDAEILRPPFEVFSFTLPLRLPACGGHLLWWDATYEQQLDGAVDHRKLGSDTARRLEYRCGQMAVHVGLVAHCIEPARHIGPLDGRITLQGHGILMPASASIYW